MLRRLPPLNAIKAFEAAARSESFTRAAEELNVTHGAVSHQVKALEATLGIRLFNRERQRLVITDAGREYLAVVRDALDRIAAGTQRLVERQSSGVLTISTSPDFAAKWLVYRLGRFAERHPEIDLRVSATMHHVDFAREDVDVAVRHGDGKWTGLEVVRLCSERLFPVCSPKLVSGRNRMTTAADLLKFPLLRLNDWNTWRRWFEAAGIRQSSCSRSDPQQREHVDRRRGRRAGHCACSHRPRGVGSHQWPSRKADRYLLENVEHVLDRLPAGELERSKDRNLPEMVVGRSGRRRAPPEGYWSKPSLRARFLRS